MKVLAQDALANTAVSAFALLVDLAIFWQLMRHLEWLYLLPATASSFSAGLVIVYTLSVSSVSEYRRVEDEPLDSASFAAIGEVGLATARGQFLLSDARLSSN